MIFRKPYKFLIKHFRLIHLLVCALSAYLIYKNHLIIGFFSDYVDSGTTTYYTNVAAKYVSFFMYLAVILILALQLFVYLLMKNKKKPRKYYIMSIIYYVIAFFVLTFAYNIFKTFENNIVEMQVASLYRDIATIISIPQYIILVISFIRGIGFNLKKFNFSKDLQEMQIDAKDNEEFEFVVGKESYKVKRNFRRAFREINYYIRENKFVFITIVVIIVGIFSTVYYLNHNVYNKVYKENDSFKNANFNIKVNKSYLTNMDFNGKFYNDYYLILKVDVTNNFSESAALNMDDYRLIAGENSFYPITTMNEKFVDLGYPYNNELINGNSTVEKLLIYKIPEKDLTNNYTLRVVNELDFRVGSIMAKYFNTKLKPEKLNNQKITNNYSLNDTISFNDTTLGNSNLVIKKYTLDGLYSYDYKSCVGNLCEILKNVIYPNNLGNYIMSIDYDLLLDKDSSYTKSIKNNKYFFINFMKVKYNYAGNTITAKVINRTPNNENDTFVFEVPSEVSNSENVQLVLKIRNHEYVIDLK